VVYLYMDRLGRLLRPRRKIVAVEVKDEAAPGQAAAAE
jgi:hypothetical protein